MFIHFACYPSSVDKLNHFVFMPKISIRVVCVNSKHPQVSSVILRLPLMPF